METSTHTGPPLTNRFNSTQANETKKNTENHPTGCGGWAEVVVASPSSSTNSSSEEGTTSFLTDSTATMSFQYADVAPVESLLLQGMVNGEEEEEEEAVLDRGDATYEALWMDMDDNDKKWQTGMAGPLPPSPCLQFRPVRDYRLRPGETMRLCLPPSPPPPPSSVSSSAPWTQTQALEPSCCAAQKPTNLFFHTRRATLSTSARGRPTPKNTVLVRPPRRQRQGVELTQPTLVPPQGGKHHHPTKKNKDTARVGGMKQGACHRNGIPLEVHLYFR